MVNLAPPKSPILNLLRELVDLIADTNSTTEFLAKFDHERANIIIHLYFQKLEADVVSLFTSKS
jgi:hypothetical protein